jgi:peptide/nickel transport system permease protein
VESILGRDYPVVTAIVIMFALTFATVNLLVDLSYSYLDPRIRLK